MGQMKRGKNLLFIIGYLLSAIIILLPATVSSQDMQRADELKYLDLGVRQMDAGEYESADQSFRAVLESVTVLPSEICYYFGVNSYYLGKYKQSINWLNKYIELKGTSGQFFDNTTEYLKKSEEAYLAQKTDQDNESEDSEIEIDYESLPDLDCGPSGKVLCPVCNGVTVIIKHDKFGKRVYQSCPYCDDHGTLTCEEYKLLLKGELKPKDERIPYEFINKQ
jgi:tetratricopeptide (TPR) repeat protein